MKYCINCGQMVEPKKRINWLGLIIASIFVFLIFGLIGVICYGIFCLIVDGIMPGVCPICNSKNWK